jgi:hypothetical protein
MATAREFSFVSSKEDMLEDAVIDKAVAVDDFLR